jgi:hypothetical protein
VHFIRQRSSYCRNEFRNRPCSVSLKPQEQERRHETYLRQAKDVSRRRHRHSVFEAMSRRGGTARTIDDRFVTAC